MRKVLSVAFAAAFLLVPQFATASGTGDIVQSGKAWRCTSAVNLNSVTVTIGAGDASNDGVFLEAGCTGYIGSITVDQWHGDGIKIGAAANLEIGSITVHCYAHDAGKHQDGVQVMGGRNVKIDSGYVGCYSANDSQLMIHEGAAGNQLPTNVLFDQITADPAGVRDPTGKPLYHYGLGGAYGVSDGLSAGSGYTNLTLLSLANRHDLYQGAGVTNPAWSFLALPAGVRANFDTSGDFVTSAAVGLRSLAGAAASVWVPAPSTTWQWQIQGQVDTTVSAQLFDIDLFDAQPGEVNAGVIATLHSQGQRVLCYMDSGAWESYRPDASQFPASVIGNSTGWSGERWLDIRRAAWPKFEQIIVDRMVLAKNSGCDGIEPDQNNPVGNNPGFPITYADEDAWYLEVAKDAHAAGLTVVQKNGIELLDDTTGGVYTAGLVAAFDGDINEQCFQYRECGGLSAYVKAGKWVGEVEYKTNSSTYCPALQAAGFMGMRKQLSLYAYRVVCW